jgi:mRNA interferase RelE/StbE
VSYSIQIKQQAAKEIRRIPKPDRLRIIRAIDDLADSPLRGAVLKGDLRGLRRLRVGDYRVVYEVQHTALILLAIRVAHRQGACDRR